MSKKQRNSYTPEFCVEAVKLITDQGYTHPEAAEGLGVPFHSLKNWVIKMCAEGKAPPLPEAEELKRLRKENQRLQIEVAVLKKAAAFFAKEIL